MERPKRNARKKLDPNFIFCNEICPSKQLVILFYITIDYLSNTIININLLYIRLAMDMVVESGAGDQSVGIGIQSSVQGKIDTSPRKDKTLNKKFRSCPRSSCPMTHPICFAGITKK